MIAESVVKAIERGAERAATAEIAGSESVVSKLESGLNDIVSAVESAASDVVSAIEKANKKSGGGGKGASFAAMMGTMTAGPSFEVYDTNKDGAVGKNQKPRKKIKSAGGGPTPGMVAASTALIAIWGKIIQKTPALKKKMGKLSKVMGKTAKLIGKAVAPAFVTVLDGIIGLFKWFNSLPGSIRTFVSMAFALVSALTILATSFMAIQAGAGAAASALGLAGSSLLATLGPILAIVAAVALLYVAWKNNFLGIQGATKQAIKWIRKQIAKFIGFVRPLWTQFANGLRKLWKVHGNALVKELRATMASLMRSIKWLVSVTKPLWKTGLKALAVITKVAFQFIKTRVLTVLDAIVTAVRVGLALLRGDWKKAGKLVLGFINRTVKRIQGLVSRLGKIFGGLAKSALKWAKNLVKKFVAGLEAKKKAFVEKITKLEQKVKNGLGDLAKSALKWAKDLVKKFVAGLEAKKKAFTEKVSKLEQKVKNGIGDLAKSAKRWGKDLISEFISGIDAKIGQLKQKVNGLKNTVQEAISFDRVENDRMAQRWGADLVDHFARGMAGQSGQLQSALPTQKPGSFGLQPATGAGSRTSVNVTVEAGAIQMRGGSTARVNAEKTAEGVANEFAQRLGRRS